MPVTDCDHSEFIDFAGEIIRFSSRVAEVESFMARLHPDIEFDDLAYPKLVELSNNVISAVEEIQATQAELVQAVQRIAGLKKELIDWYENEIKTTILPKLVPATATQIGFVKPDNTTLRVDADGQLSVIAEIQPRPNSLVLRDANGDIQGNITGSSTFADLAEIYSSNEELQVGDVVSVASEGFDIHKAQAGETALGIVSERPGALLNCKDKNKPGCYAIARVGIVSARIQGEVKKGERICVAENGMARACQKGEPGFAWALESGSEMVKCVI